MKTITLIIDGHIGTGKIHRPNIIKQGGCSKNANMRKSCGKCASFKGFITTESFRCSA